jgi:hypothetical protein
MSKNGEQKPFVVRKYISCALIDRKYVSCHNKNIVLILLPRQYKVKLDHCGYYVKASMLET